MNTKTKLLIIFSIITIFGCNNQIENKGIQENKKIGPCNQYFEYDQIDHYFLDFRIDKPLDLKNKTEEQKNLLDEILQGSKPYDISDTLFLSKLEKLDYKKRKISETKFEQINQIFCERKHKEVILTPCPAIYRDVLVFKNRNKIIGMAKICFDCGQKIIVGTKANTTEFGQSGDFEKLFGLLR